MSTSIHIRERNAKNLNARSIFEDERLLEDDAKRRKKNSLLKKYKITGGASLNGSVRISGSKNAVLPIFAATLLTDDEVILHNVPKLRDTYTMTVLLEKLGKKVLWEGSTVHIHPNGEKKEQPIRAMYEIVKQMRASICVLGPLLARHRHVEVSLPGGCVFGPRPIDLHLRGLSDLGADLEIHHGDIIAKVKKARLQGSKLSLLGPFGTSVLATDNIVSAAVLASGRTVIQHAAREPETGALISFLQSMGADIVQSQDDDGSSRLEINGVTALKGTEVTIIPDRIEAGTFMVIAALTGGDIILEGMDESHLSVPLKILNEIGMICTMEEGMEDGRSGLRLQAPPLGECRPFRITTGAYPDFPTDLQPLFVSLGCLLPGESIICDHIYPNRFNHVPELLRMGAKLEIEEKCVRIHGVKMLEGARVQSSDLRSGAALVAAALCASGESEVRRIYHIERGYEAFPEKLGALGGDVRTAFDAVI